MFNSLKICQGGKVSASKKMNLILFIKHLSDCFQREGHRDMIVYCHSDAITHQSSVAYPTLHLHKKQSRSYRSRWYKKTNGII